MHIAWASVINKALDCTHADTTFTTLLTSNGYLKTNVKYKISSISLYLKGYTNYVRLRKSSLTY